MVIIITGRYIKELREKSGLTQTGLAKAVGVTQAHIARIEGENVDPRLSTVNKILAVLQATKKKVTCSDIMITKVFNISKNSTVVDAIRMMKRHDISQLPVVDKDKVIGSIKESTITKMFDKITPKTKVNEVMEEPFPMINVKDSVEVPKSLLDFHPAILVTDKGKVVGIITKSDLFKLIK